MADITASMVKDLRDKTGAGMMDCKKALAEANGDMEAAIDCLRKAGIAKAAKKASRSATEGLVVIAIDKQSAAAVEALCETDFVAKNEKFVDFANRVVASAIAQPTDGDVAAAVNAEYNAELTEMVARIGENQQIRRAVRWQGGKFASYLHMGGRIGVLVNYEGEAAPDQISDMCMHIAAFSPRFVTAADVPAELIEREKEIAAGQVVGKPANMVEKIVAGKIAKWYTEVCLVKQPWIRDDKTCLEKVAPKLMVKRFLRWAVGEEL